MLRITEIKLPVENAQSLTHQADEIKAALLKRLEIPASDLIHFEIFKRGVDARKSHAILYVYSLDVEVKNEAKILARFRKDAHIKPAPDTEYKYVAHNTSADKPRPVVVGFGPAGIFAALILAQSGFRPIVLERGKAVRERTKDTWGLWRKNKLNPESNVQFGEGGAGTFSDGKLYSQIKDPRHLGRKVMNEFVRFGAPEEILFTAHPHIGTFKLVKVVEGLREEIIRLGGEVRFEQRVTDVEYDDQRQLQALRIHNHATDETYTLPAHHVVMALGHSSRDTFTMLHRHAVAMEAKPFSVGVRIEHPQGVIDRARWGQHAGHPLLGAADYKLVHHAENGRAVYSFCMCPGGTVVAATSEAGRVVTNGMSQYSRAERNANAGIVVGIDPSDYPTDPAAFEAELGQELGNAVRHTTHDAPGGYPPLAGLVLQRQLEAHAYTLGGSSYEAPAQLVGDFIADRASTALGSVEPSYKPGVKMVSLNSALPSYAIAAMREALPVFGRKIKGFDMHDAVMTGVETRTSSPLRIAREDDTLQSPNLGGLYPAGEGAGYAGGILSAGVDGIKVGEAVARQLMTAPR